MLCFTMVHPIGAAWVQDGFDQNVLALQAMRLAVDFPRLGGTFLIKVFRSKDYDALIWVFKQLFDTVESTKPPASRNVSAEIFVICRGFKAPQLIDPRVLDPHAVFTEMSAHSASDVGRVFTPEKKRRGREGYSEGDCFRQTHVNDLVHTSNPVAMLGALNKLDLEQTVVMLSLKRFIGLLR